MKVTINTDGGSRGNPGPAALGVVIFAEDGSVLKAFGEYLGETTNNIAEYTALQRALEEAKKLGAEEVGIKMDSELVVRQMNGIYKIKHPNLIPIAQKIKTLQGEFKKVTFTHVRREYNSLADAEVNKVLDNLAQG
jgi:ribonuclease HI